jgi:hypothetical protein
VIKSTDGGATWAKGNWGLPQFSQVNVLLVDTLMPSTVYAGTYAGGVYKSTDGGASWVAANSGADSIIVESLAFNPADPAVLYAGTDGNGIFQALAGPDFSISLSSPTITASAGSKVPVLVRIGRVNGFTGKVTVTPPAGTARIQLKPPTPITTEGESAKFKLKIRSDAPPGMQQLVFTGSDASGRLHSATLVLEVQ